MYIIMFTLATTNPSHEAAVMSRSHTGRKPCTYGDECLETKQSNKACDQFQIAKASILLGPIFNNVIHVQTIIP